MGYILEEADGNASSRNVIISILLFDKGLWPKYPEYNLTFFDHPDNFYKIRGKSHDLSLLKTPA